MILRLTEDKGYARSVDIALGLGVSKPSVSVAMKQLREGGYIVMDKDNYISLTDTGMEIAHRIYERHKVLTRMLTMIGVDEKTAEADACKVEHDISVQTFTALKDQLVRPVELMVKPARLAVTLTGGHDGRVGPHDARSRQPEVPRDKRTHYHAVAAA